MSGWKGTVRRASASKEVQVLSDSFSTDTDGGNGNDSASTFSSPSSKPLQLNISPEIPPPPSPSLPPSPSSPPLPFKLPNLSVENLDKLRLGERVQEQERMKSSGTGYVVMDVDSDIESIWKVLLDFHNYAELIPTVRNVTMVTKTVGEGEGEGRVNEEDALAASATAFTDGTLARLGFGSPSVTRASFVLSKLRLNIAAVHKYTPHPAGGHMVFTLDPSCANVVLKMAEGVWHTQPCPYDPSKTRLWLLCSIRVSRALPKWIMNYAAGRAMPRATEWVRPAVERVKETRRRDGEGGE